MFYIMSIAVETDLGRIATLRNLMAAQLPDLINDYTCMLSGSAAVPNQTSPHFTLVTQGKHLLPFILDRRTLSTNYV